MTVAVVSVSGEDLVIRPQVGLLPELKTLGARWSKPDDAWRLPDAQMHRAAIGDLLGGEVEWRTPRAAVERPLQVTDERLFDWQRPGASSLVNARHGHLLCATPGLGKTAMAITAADVAVPDDQVLVVAPAPLLRNWSREIKTWARDSTTAVVHGGEPDWNDVKAARWVVTSWDVLALHQDWFMGSWPLLIMDESVMAKSRRSTRSLMIRGGVRRGRRRPDGSTTPEKRWANLGRSIERIWLLSGSPTTRYADDLWAQLNMMWPRAFPSYWRFAERYCVVEPNMWAPGPGVVTATRRDRDAIKDNSDMVTVMSQEKLIDLPDFLPEAVDVDLRPKQMRAYTDMLRDFLVELEDGGKLVAENRMSQLIRLQQIVSFHEGESAKHDALIELLEGGAYETPILVWTHWRDGAAAVTERLAKLKLRVGHVHGGMTAKAKDAEIESYKAGGLDALVLSLGVGRFGHTLTNTKTIAYIDKTWDADAYRQSLLRVKRIGLTWRPVLASFRAPGTVDELVEMNLQPKMEGISRITNANLRELLLGLGR